MDYYKANWTDKIIKLLSLIIQTLKTLDSH
jgi:hypothetical protein